MKITLTMMISQKLCKHFLKGQCTKKDCAFVHDEKKKERYHKIKFFTVCKYYLGGNCKNGDNCAFKHPASCKYYAKGTCTNKNCMFLHVKK